MTTSDAPFALEQINELRRWTRQRRVSSAWLPLAIFGLVMVGADQLSRSSTGLAAIPADGGFREDKQNWLANLAGAPANVTLALYWLVALPAAFTVTSLWLRARSRRDGVDQAWRPGTLAALVPFAALVVLRLVIEPASPAVHRLLSYGSRGAWFQPLACFMIGIVVWAAMTRSRVLIASCLAAAVVNGGWWVLRSGDARYNSSRDDLIGGIDRLPSPLSLGVLGLTGLALIGLSAAWLVMGVRTRASKS